MDNTQPLVLLALIEATGINDLSHHFQRWLSTILLLRRHVKVVNKDDESCAWVFRAVDTFFVFFKS